MSEDVVVLAAVVTGVVVISTSVTVTEASVAEAETSVTGAEYSVTELLSLARVADVADDDSPIDLKGSAQSVSVSTTLRFTMSRRGVLRSFITSAKIAEWHTRERFELYYCTLEEGKGIAKMLLTPRELPYYLKLGFK